MKKKLIIISIAILLGLSAFGWYTILPMPQKAPIVEVGQLSLFGQMNGYNTSMFYTQIKAFQEKGIIEVEVFVMSPGGVVVDAFGVCDVIEKAKNEGMHFTMLARGMVASAAIPVFLAGDVRIAGAHTIFMLHTPERMDIEDENYHEIMDLNEKLYMGIVAKYSWLTYAEVKKMCDDFTWMSALEAKSHGFVDKIE